jgi:uncharacterized protein
MNSNTPTPGSDTSAELPVAAPSDVGTQPAEPITPIASTPSGLTADDFDELDAILDEMRTRYDEVPQWEFCEGFMAALICCRRPMLPSEYLPVLLGLSEADELDFPDEEADSEEAASDTDDEALQDLAQDDAGAASFADPGQAIRFLSLWQRRWDEVATALNTPIDALDDDRAYAPEVMDVRGAIATLPEAERAELEGELLPAFAQIWALGFMFAVECWPEEWEAPRDKDTAKWHDAALEAIVALTEDDEDEPTLSALGEDGPPSVSEARLNAYGDALWAVYDLREIWRNIGPRVLTVHRDAKVGRNELCPCGSGKKYKKCCGQ